tara:strand:+ start:2734 stop:10560 length:7827 start_codon:yes stop_codon:yes gene_type:complete
MDKLEQLYNLYVDKGILTSQTTLDQFKQSDLEIQGKLYDLGKNKGLFNETDLDTFQGAWSDVKKKDSFLLQDALAPKDTKDSQFVSQDTQSSLEEKVQQSVDNRIGKTTESKINPLEFKRSFYEAKGIDFDSFLDLKSQESAIEEKLKTTDFSKDVVVNPFAKTESLFQKSFVSKEQSSLRSQLDSIKNKIDLDSDKISSAEVDYSNSVFQDIARKAKSTAEFDKMMDDAGIDFNDIRLGNLSINIDQEPGQLKNVSPNEFQKIWRSKENINNYNNNDELVEGYTKAISEGVKPEDARKQFPFIEVRMGEPGVKDPMADSMNKYFQRQVNSGGAFGDLAETLLAETIGIGTGITEQLEAAPAALGLKPTPLKDDDDYADMSAWDLYMNEGGYYSKKFQDYANTIREKTRIPEYDSIAEAIANGDVDDAFFQLGLGIASTIPITAAMFASGPVAGFGIATMSSAGRKSLELKDNRKAGEDLDNWQILTSSNLSGLYEGTFELVTQRILSNAIKVGGKAGIRSAKDLTDSYKMGITKAAFRETASEEATFGFTYLTDVALDVQDPESISELAVKAFDIGVISSVFGGAMHLGPRAISELSNNFKNFDKGTTVRFTDEDGSVKNMSRSEFLTMSRDPKIAKKINDKVVFVDVSLDSNAKKSLDNIVNGFGAPDALQKRKVMFRKEADVVSLSRKIRESVKDPDVGLVNEDVSELANKLVDLKLETKKSKYNETDKTRYANNEANKVLRDNNINIVDAVDSQDISMSDIETTVDIKKIKLTEDQYNSLNNQFKRVRFKKVKDKDGKTIGRAKTLKSKPFVVLSQDKPGIKIDGNTIQKSKVTIGEFSSVKTAKNAIREFEARKKAFENNKMIESDLLVQNNKLFSKTSKSNLDPIPRDLIEGDDYFMLTSDLNNITDQQQEKRMSSLMNRLDNMGATYYKVKDVYNALSKNSLVVSGIDTQQALSLGRSFEQESIFSAKDGLMYSDGSVAPLNGSFIEGVDSRSKDALTILNIDGEKTSIYTGLDFKQMSYGKSFNSDNLHRLDEDDPNYDSELLDGITEDRKKMLGVALNLITNVKGVNVTVIRNNTAFKSQLMALGETETDAQSFSNSKGFYHGKDGKIYINLQNLEGNTLFHEVAHPMIDFIRKNNPEVYKRIESIIMDPSYIKRWREDGQRKSASYLDWAKENYREEDGFNIDQQIQEAFAEMIGDSSYGKYRNKDRGAIVRIRELTRLMLSNIYSNPFNINPESISLDDLSKNKIRDAVSDALVEGRAIKIGGVEFDVGKIDSSDPSIKYQSSYSDRITGLTFEYAKDTEVFKEKVSDGIITKGKSFSEFSDNFMALHIPDNAMFGKISKDGNTLVNGKGGVYAAANEEGKVWLSTRGGASSLRNRLNQSSNNNNNGKGYLALITSNQKKVLTNTISSSGIVEMFVEKSKDGFFNVKIKDINRALVKASNKTKLNQQGKKVGLKTKLKLSESIDDVSRKINNILGPEKSTFQDREFFVESLLNEIALIAQKNKSFNDQLINLIQQGGMYENFVGARTNKISKSNLIDGMSFLFSEPTLRSKNDLTPEDKNLVYAIVEIDANPDGGDIVKTVETGDYHESYPMSIDVVNPKQKVRLHILGERPLWTKVFKDPNTGKEILQERTVTNKILAPSAGLSGKPLQAMNISPDAIKEQRALRENVKFQRSRVKLPLKDVENVYNSDLVNISLDATEPFLKRMYDNSDSFANAFNKTKNYSKFLVDFFTKPKGVHSNQEIKEAFIQSKGNVRKEIINANQDLNKIKELADESPYTDQEIQALLSDIEAIQSMEESDLKHALEDARHTIDNLSRILVEEDLVTPATAFTIDSNYGVYLKKSYKQFEDNKFTQTNEEIKKRALDLLIRENKKLFPIGTPIGDEGAVVDNEFINKTSEENLKTLMDPKLLQQYASSSNSADPDKTLITNIYRQRNENIPQEIKDLWEEIDEPYYNYLQTISLLSHNVSTQRLYKKLIDIGMNKFIADPIESTGEDGKTKVVSSIPEIKNRLLGKKYGLLEGKFVDDEIFDVLTSSDFSFDNSSLQKAYNTYMKIVLLNKEFNTVLSTSTQVINFVGNINFAVQNGHISMSSLNDMYKAGRASIGAIRGFNDQQSKELYSELLEMGVVQSSASLELMKELSNDLYNSDYDLDKYLDQTRNKVEKGIGKVASIGSKTRAKFQKSYQLADDVWKVFGYLNEKARYKRAGLTEDQAKLKAARLTRATYPNYDEIPRAVRLIGRSPLLGTFVSFQAEVLRNTKNSLKIGLEEIGDSNPDIKNIGKKRLAFLLSSFTLFQGFQLYLANSFFNYVSNDDDDEFTGDVDERHQRELVRPWDGIGNIANVDKGFTSKGEPYFDYYNVSRQSGTAYLGDLLNLAFTEMEDPENDDKVFAIIKRLYEPFIGEEMTLSMLVDIYNNKSGKYYNPEDDPAEKAFSIALGLAEEIPPGAIKSAMRVYDAYMDDEDQTEFGYELLAAFGFRATRVIVPKQANYKFRNISYNLKSRAKGSLVKGLGVGREGFDYRDLNKLNEVLNPLSDVYDEKFDGYIDELARVARSCRLNHMNRFEIEQAMSKAGIPQSVIIKSIQRYRSLYSNQIRNKTQ